MGLLLANATIERLGGSVHIADRDGGGAWVRVMLPLHAVPTGTRQHDASRGRSTSRLCCSSTTTQCFAMYCRARCADAVTAVVTAGGCRQRLSISAADDPPEFAVVDLKMPGASGPDSSSNDCISARARHADRRVDRLREHRDRVEAVKLGAVDYLSKPATADEVVAALGATAATARSTSNAAPASVERLEWEHIQRVLDRIRRQRLGHRPRAENAPPDAAAETFETPRPRLIAHPAGAN